MKTSSLAYKFLDYFDHGNVPNNLCPLIRKLVLYGLMVSSVSCFLGTIFVGMIFDVIVILGFCHNLLKLYWVGEIWSFGVMGWIFLILGGILFLIVHIGTNLKYSDKPPGLIYQYWKAIHDKVCPLIEFEDDK